MNSLVLDYLILTFLAFTGITFGVLGSNYQSRLFGIAAILLASGQLMKVLYGS